MGRPIHFVLIGHSGCGKTTLAKALEAETGLPHVSSGDIARTLAHQDHNTQMALSQGMMAPEEAMRHQVRRALEQADATRGGWILEGFPRSMAQLICLTQWCATPTFVFLDVPVLVCIHRLVQRNRDDDNADSIARKIEGFARHTQPMIDAIAERGPLFRFYADQMSRDLLARRVWECGQ